MTVLLCKALGYLGSFCVVSSSSYGYCSPLWSRMANHCIHSLASRVEERGKGKRTPLPLRTRPRRCNHRCSYLLTCQNLVKWPAGCLGGRDIYLCSGKPYVQLCITVKEKGKWMSGVVGVSATHKL